MSSSICSFSMVCPSNIDSLTNGGKIVGIVVGSVLGLAFLSCIVVIFYLIFCKRRPQARVWAYPCPRPQPYGQITPTYSYSNYPHGPIRLSSTDSHKILDEPPPAYEEISTIEQLA
jgi:hypothetical protein